MSRELDLALVLVPHSQLLQISSDMISGTSIGVPISVNSIGCSNYAFIPFIKNKILIKPVPTVHHRVALLEAQLALGPSVGVVPAAAVVLARGTVATPFAAVVAAASSIVASTATLTPTSPTRHVGGGVRVGATVKQLHALLEAEQLGIHPTHSHRFRPCNQGGHDGVVVVIFEAGQDVGDELVVDDQLARVGHLISQRAHLADVLDDGEITFLRCGEDDPSVDGASFHDQREHFLDDSSHPSTC